MQENEMQKQVVCMCCKNVPVKLEGEFCIQCLKSAIALGDYENERLKHIEKALGDKMVEIDLDLCKELFNTGKLNSNDAQWFQDKGYDVVCANGKVESIMASSSCLSGVY